MSFQLSASKQFKLLRLLKPHENLYVPSTRSLLHRNLSSEPDSQSSPPEDDESIVQQLVQTPETQWDLSQLHSHLFSSDSTRRRLINISRHLGSFQKTLKLFEFVQSNLSQEDAGFLPVVYQSVFEQASREPGWQNRLLELYRTSKERNVPLTVDSANILIRYLGKADMVEDAIAVFNDLEPGKQNIHIQNALINVLLRSGWVDDALKVFYEMFEKNTELKPNYVTGDIFFSWLSMRQRLGRSLNEGEVIDLVLKLAQHGIFANSVWLTQFITGLCWKRMTSQAWDLLQELMKMGCVETASCNALLVGLGRKRDFDRMNELMAKMKELDIQPNVVTFGILVNYLCKFQRIDEALEILNKMSGAEKSVGFSVEPDVVIFNTLIDGLCKVGRQEEGLGLMKQAKLKKGSKPNVVTYNCLIDGFCKSGEIDRAHELFDEMNRIGILPNVITLNTLVNGMCKHGRINSAVEFFSSMKKKGLRGNAHTYTAFINSFCNVNNIDKAMKYFDEMLETGCSVDAVVYYSLIASLCLAGRMDDASTVVSQLKKAGFYLDTPCYNQMINGFCKKNKLDKATEMLQEMEDSGLKPDSVTYNTLISCFSKSGKFSLAHSVMNKMISDGLLPTVVTYGALIHAYCLNGKIDNAMEIFRYMGSASRVPSNTVIYNILIDALCQNNDVHGAIALMEDMKTKGVKPNTTTFNAMFKGLREEKLLEEAFVLMDRMIKYACKPDYKTMEILTYWLSAVGETEKLKHFFQGYDVSASSA